MSVAFIPNVPAGTGWLACGRGPGGAEGVLDSAVFRLVGAVYESRQGEAHRILRQRLHVTSAEHELDRAVVQVAASRIRFEAQLPDGSEGSDEAITRLTWLDEVADGLGDIYNPVAALPLPAGPPQHIAMDLQAQVNALPVDLTRKRALRDRPVAAALVDRAGIVRVAARNTAGRNKTRHAEVNLVALAAEAGLLPFAAGWTVVTTLSPCRMCAAILLHSFQRAEDAKVLYAERDLGRLAQHTVLDRNGAAGILA